jgi:dipeptidyl aminopeptidase/acylaminoacyl peptidase
MKWSRVFVCGALISMATGPQQSGAVPQARGTAFVAGHRFTVKDDIEMTTYIGDPLFSPDGKWFLVLTQRGLLERNVPEYTIWLWPTEAVDASARNSSGRAPPTAVPLARIAGYKDGNIGGLRVDWLEDSKSIAYVSRTDKGTFRLFRVSVDTRNVEALTSETENVTGFSFRGNDYVYTVSSPEIMQHASQSLEGQAISVTGRRMWDIFQPLAQHPEMLAKYTYSELWAVVGGKRFQVEDRKTNEPVHLYPDSETNFFSKSSFTLSPDRKSLAVIVPVGQIPAAWAKYQAPVGYESIMRPLWPAEIFGRAQTITDNLENPEPAFRALKSYFILDLASGAAIPTVEAPTGDLLDWNADLRSAAWSADGQSLLLSNTFLPLDTGDARQDSERERHPCLTAYELQTRRMSCVLALKAGRDLARFGLADARFDGGNAHRVIVDYTTWRLLPGAATSAVFVQGTDGAWHAEAGSIDPVHLTVPIDVRWQENENDPWKLVATSKKTGGKVVLWDPNPQLADVDWGGSKLMRWKGEEGGEYTANLLTPPDYVPGKRYPLVIQTHGFLGEDRFITSGRATTGFAAREMTGAGLVVAQIDRVKAYDGSPREGQSEVDSYVSLVKKLNDEGLIDPEKVGLIGFSRTVYHTYEALVRGRPGLAAASVIEGINMGYWEYLEEISSAEPGKEFETVIGAAPFGEGLKTWVDRSPMFHLDKVQTPLLIFATGMPSALGAWEPYAALYRQHKPVDMVLLKAGEHLQSNPQQRLASQGMTVDWYRFWLQGYEDPDALKAGQYRRWEALCDLQKSQTPDHATFCVGSKH